MSVRLPPSLALYVPEEFPDRSSVVKHLKILSDVLDKYCLKYKTKYWIDWGTLLGAHREGKIIDWDYDIDIGLLVTEEDVLWNKWVQANLLHMLQEHFFIQYFNPHVSVSVIPHEFDDFHLNQIDITFYTNRGTKYIDGCRNKIFRAFFVDELETTTLYNQKFPSPRHIEEFLDIRYGLDWRVPKKDFSPIENTLKDKDHYIAYTSLVGDFFHAGHQNLLRRCSELFDTVIVGVHNDEDVESYKQRPYMPYQERLKLILQCPYVDKVVENAPVITTEAVLDSVKADFAVAGREDDSRIQKMYPISPKKLHLIERTPGISSSIIRKQMMTK